MSLRPLWTGIGGGLAFTGALFFLLWHYLSWSAAAAGAYLSALAVVAGGAGFDKFRFGRWARTASDRLGPSSMVLAFVVALAWLASLVTLADRAGDYPQPPLYLVALHLLSVLIWVWLGKIVVLPLAKAALPLAPYKPTGEQELDYVLDQLEMMREFPSGWFRMRWHMAKTPEARHLVRRKVMRRWEIEGALATLKRVPSQAHVFPARDR